MSGYGTAQELLLYKDIGDNSYHKLVILGYYLGNDLKNNAYPVPRRPAYELVDGELQFKRDPKTGGATGTITRIAMRHLIFPKFIYKQLKRVQAATGDSRHPVPPTGTELRYQINLTKALLARLGHTVKQQGTELLIIPIPERGDVVPSNPHHYPADTGEPNWEAQRAMLQQLANTSSTIHLLNLKYDLSSYIRPQMLYGRIDGHLDDRGHYITARSIYTWLRSNNYTQTRSTVFYRFNINKTDCQ